MKKEEKRANWIQKLGDLVYEQAKFRDDATAKLKQEMAKYQARINAVATEIEKLDKGKKNV